MIEDILKKRFQVREFNDIIPDKKIINSLLNKTYELVASKQNIIPYQILVQGPEHKKEKEEFRNFCRFSTNLNFDYARGTIQLLAPYNIFFCIRDIKKTKDINPSVLEKIERGQSFSETHKHSCDSSEQVGLKTKQDICIEIGMFSQILTELCLEKKLLVAYTLCMPSWKNSKNGDSDGWKNFSFLPKEVLFVMSIGYSNETERAEYKNKYEYKPSKNNIIKWL